MKPITLMWFLFAFKNFEDKFDLTKINKITVLANVDFTMSPISYTWYYLALFQFVISNYI